MGVQEQLVEAGWGGGSLAVPLPRGPREETGLVLGSGARGRRGELRRPWVGQEREGCEGEKDGVSGSRWYPSSLRLSQPTRPLSPTGLTGPAHAAHVDRRQDLGSPHTVVRCRRPGKGLLFSLAAHPTPSSRRCSPRGPGAAGKASSVGPPAPSWPVRTGGSWALQGPPGSARATVSLEEAGPTSGREKRPPHTPTHSRGTSPTAFPAGWASKDSAEPGGRAGEGRPGVLGVRGEARASPHVWERANGPSPAETGNS